MSSGMFSYAAITLPLHSPKLSRPSCWLSELDNRSRVRNRYVIAMPRSFRDAPLPLFRIVANAEGNRQPYEEHVHQQAFDEPCKLERAPKVKR
jgi:hypothetical protein